MNPHYEAPKITKVDTLTSLTRGNDDGQFTDATFPVGTPKPNLTFS